MTAKPSGSFPPPPNVAGATPDLLKRPQSDIGHDLPQHRGKHGAGLAAIRSRRISARKRPAKRRTILPALGVPKFFFAGPAGYSAVYFVSLDTGSKRATSKRR
jgi:hypothetical protein